MTQRGLNCLCVMLLMALSGCGNESTVLVTGTVLCDGQPLENGEILLLDEGGSVRPVWAAVKQGRFEMQSTPGHKRVEIRATRPKSADKNDPDAAGLREDFIPARYNRASTLRENVTQESATELKFEIFTRE